MSSADVRSKLVVMLLFIHRLRLLLLIVVFFMFGSCFMAYILVTLDRWQSETFLTIDERGSYIARNSVYDCHLSPDWQQMVIVNSVSNDFLSTFIYNNNVFDCRISRSLVSSICFNYLS